MRTKISFYQTLQCKNVNTFLNSHLWMHTSFYESQQALNGAVFTKITRRARRIAKIEKKMIQKVGHNIEDDFAAATDRTRRTARRANPAHLAINSKHLSDKATLPFDAEASHAGPCDPSDQNLMGQVRVPGTSEPHQPVSVDQLLLHVMPSPVQKDLTWASPETEPRLPPMMTLEWLQEAPLERYLQPLMSRPTQPAPPWPHSAQGSNLSIQPILSALQVPPAPTEQLLLAGIYRTLPTGFEWPRYGQENELRPLRVPPPSGSLLSAELLEAVWATPLLTRLWRD